MIIIPAVDIKDGKCVRLFQGKMDKETIFSDEPHLMAKKWEDQGAKLLHLVDLDGAFHKKSMNFESIKKIVKELKIPVQVGGGIRNHETLKKYFDIGVDKIVIGTKAVKEPEFLEDMCEKYPNKIILALDAIDGFVATEAWYETSKIKSIDLLKKFEHLKLFAVNCTDIKRDGAKVGPNIEEILSLCKSTSLKIVASGGVSTIEDIKNLLKIEKHGVFGVITGRALYDGSLDLTEAILLVSSYKADE